MSLKQCVYEPSTICAEEAASVATILHRRRLFCLTSAFCVLHDLTENWESRQGFNLYKKRWLARATCIYDVYMYMQHTCTCTIHFTTQRKAKYVAQERTVLLLCKKVIDVQCARERSLFRRLAAAALTQCLEQHVVTRAVRPYIVAHRPFYAPVCSRVCVWHRVIGISKRGVRSTMS